ncbi:MAG: 50S ribosomal protein L34 [Sedimentisphaerales bacterium]|nr:50S ribosomal protein L34 [Sedimentisphaerales bacterium]
MENHRISKIKKKRKSGFRAKMRTKGGRNVLSRKRRRKTSLSLR